MFFVVKYWFNLDMIYAIKHHHRHKVISRLEIEDLIPWSIVVTPKLRLNLTTKLSWSPQPPHIRMYPRSMSGESGVEKIH
jgi:hypothetical protein